MITKVGLICMIFFFIITNGVFVGTASECCYGSVYAQFRTNTGEWENATAHPQLQRGQEFDIKITVTTKTALQVFFIKLHEFGTPAFEVLDGPTTMEQIFENRQQVESNQTSIYLWKMRVKPQTTWVNGYAPLEVFTQFNRNDTDDCRIRFDVITAFIIDETWQDGPDSDMNRNHSSVDQIHQDVPGFQFIGMLLITLLYLLIKMRRNTQ